jgi:threonine/homoserine/homoserine lactone efflux protein
MSLEVWLAFCLMDVVLCFTPGPAVLYVVSVALSRGFRPGLAAAGGILAGNTMYFALSATGITAVLLASGALFDALKTAGAAYLVWVGLRMVFSRNETRATVAPRHERSAFLRGFVVQGANPKALIFFVALVPQFIDPAGSLGLQILILGVTGVVIELAVLTLYVTLAVRARRLAGARLAGTLERVGGAFLVAAGARLAVARAR